MIQLIKEMWSLVFSKTNFEKSKLQLVEIISFYSLDYFPKPRGETRKLMY